MGTPIFDHLDLLDVFATDHLFLLSLFVLQTDPLLLTFYRSILIHVSAHQDKKNRTRSGGIRGESLLSTWPLRMEHG